MLIYDIFYQIWFQLFAFGDLIDKNNADSKLVSNQIAFVFSFGQIYFNLWALEQFVPWISTNYYNPDDLGSNDDIDAPNNGGIRAPQLEQHHNDTGSISTTEKVETLIASQAGSQSIPNEQENENKHQDQLDDYDDDRDQDKKTQDNYDN